MSIPLSIDGIWRDVWSSHVRINGVWRDTEVGGIENGIHRTAHRNDLTATDIIGFRLIYQRNDSIDHPLFPNLKYNPNIPHSIHLTGADGINMNTDAKSIIFQFGRENAREEGKILYTGTLFAVVKGDIYINVGSTTGGSTMEDYQYDPGIPGIKTAWVSNRIKNIDIKLHGTMLHESHGYYTAGWNRFLTKIDTIDPSVYPDKEPHEITSEISEYPATPPMYREDRYSKEIMIGIARDVSSLPNNMVGSYGTLDHTLEKIFVNGEQYPFSMEFYD